MENLHNEIYTHVLPALESKKNEFKVYQYDTVTELDLWKYLVHKKWRKKEVASISLHQIVNDIMSLTPAEYMTFEHIENVRSSNWFAEINQEELQVLLNPKKAEAEEEKE